MSEKTRLGLTLLGAALALGLLGDALRALPLGLNVPVWIAALVLALIFVARLRGIPLTGGGRWLIVPALGFALEFALRDSPSLTLANLLALFACVALIASYSRAGRIAVAGLLDYALAAFWLGFDACFGALQLCLADIDWPRLPRGIWGGRVAAVARGIAIALPLALIFGALFASADPVFSGIVSVLFSWDLTEIVLHLLWIAFWAVLVAGGARLTFLGPPVRLPEISRPEGLRIGIVETATVLAVLDALFLAFVVVQLRYLFGGAALVEASVTMTYAEYARRGFFELVAVAALSLPMLLAGEWLLGRGSLRDERLFRVLAGLLVALIFVVLASAFQRMQLYQAEFGMTELRLYTTAFMGWLAALFAWFAATVLRGRRPYFAFGAMVAGFVVVAALDALNPDAFIVSTNAALAVAGKPFDHSYVATLSADAVPEIVKALPGLPEQERQRLAKLVLDRWSRPPSADLRSWNWARSQAWQSITSNDEPLRAAAR